MKTVEAHRALQMLKEGNERFVSNQRTCPNQSAERRREIVGSQHPFAIVFGCSDSRVPPELLFDQGMGDLFVVRVAGHVPDDAAIGSLEYAVEHLKVHLILVLGHQRCGAVDAAVKGGEAPGHVGVLLKAIRPSVEKAKSRPGDLLENSIRAHIAAVVEELRSSSPLLASEVRTGELEIVGGCYELEEGRVEFLK